MPERWAGISAYSDRLILVSVEIDEENNLALIHDKTWDLQQGDRVQAYRVLYDRVLNYLRESHIDHVAFKGTSFSSMGMNKSNLDAAELRGVIMVAAAQTGVAVTVTTKSKMTKKLGKQGSRKVDAYLEDNDFWMTQFGAGLRKGSRETAMLILDARK